MTVPLRRRGTRAEALSGGVLHVVTPTLWYRTPEGVQGIKEVDRARLVRGTPYGHSSHCIGSCECNHDPPRRVSQERGTSWAAPGLGVGIRARRARDICFKGVRPITPRPPRRAVSVRSPAHREERPAPGDFFRHPDCHARCPGNRPSGNFTFREVSRSALTGVASLP